eukprot:jgi/Mesen1/4349/ME000022S03639
MMSLAGTPRRLSNSNRFDDLPRSSSTNSNSLPVRISSRNVSLADNGQVSFVGDMGVEAAEAASKAALEEIDNDEVFSKFVVPNFNATVFASQALSTGSAVASSQKLNEGIQLLERQLRNEVVLRHGELLQQLSSLKDTESVLAVVRAGVESLQASVQRVRSEIADPYKHIKLKTRQLAALHETVELLRSVIKFLKQVHRLKSEMAPGGPKVDLAKAAQLYNEIETLRKEADLSGVDVVEAETGWLAEVGQQIRSDATRSLEAGMESLNQAEVGSVLQVYYNMGELRSTVELLVNRYKVQATKSITTALDMKAISASTGGVGLGASPGGIARSGTPQLGAAPKARDALWQRMSACMESVHAILLATWHLQRVLAKKRDPITHVVFLDEVVQPGEPTLTEKVWEAVVRAMTSQLKAAFTASSFIKETFVGSYPRLVGLLEALLDRLARDTEVKGVPPAVQDEHRPQLTAALTPFQGAYLGQSLARMTDIVSLMFPAGSRGAIPGPEAVQRLVARIADEVEAVRTNEGLSALVLGGVGKALKLLADRSEYQVATGPDGRQVTGPMTAAQQRNSSLCLSLQDVHQRVSAVLASLLEGSGSIARPGLDAIRDVAADAITPLFKAMVERAEACLLQMHDQSLGSDEADGMGGTVSKYLDDTLKAITLFRAEFLSKLVPSLPHASAAAAAAAAAGAAGEPICTGLTRRLASRVLLFFVRHAALVRPLSEAGKLRMAQDMAELEFAVGQNLFAVEYLGAPYRALRAFRSLLFLETSQLANSTLLQDIPPSVVLHHLYTRAPEELESPIKRGNLTPAKYSMWLDTRSEEEAWRGIKASLDAYAQNVHSRGDKEFTPVYPLMLSLGQTLVENAPPSSR